MARILGGSESLSFSPRDALIYESRQRSIFLREKYIHWDSVQRQAHIDELAFGNNFLREQGIPREYINQVLQSFEPGQMVLNIADDSTYGLRFYRRAREILVHT